MKLDIFVLICAVTAIMINAENINLEGQTKTINVYLVSWINNRPYYLPQDSSIEITKGLLPMAIRQQLPEYCHAKRDGFKFMYHDDPKYHLQSEKELLTLINQSSKTKILQRLNTTENSTDIFIVAGTTNKQKNSNIFKRVPIIQTEKAVLIVRTKDILLLKRFWKGIWKCNGVIFFAVTCAVNLGALIWIIERTATSKSDFQNTFGAGLWTSFWYCFVTMTTVGYGDKVPKHFLSRILCLVWMLFGLMLTAIITTTVMEAVQDEFSKFGIDIAVTDSPLQRGLVTTRLAGNPVVLRNVEEIFEAVRSNQVVAGLMDAFVASYVFSEEKIDDLKMESVISMQTWMYGYVINFNRDMECHFEDEKHSIPDIYSSKFRSMFVPHFSISHYYARSFIELFNKQDGGLVLYISIVAGCLVAIGFFTEIGVKVWRRRPSSSIKRGNVADEENLIEQLQLIEEMEKQFLAKIDTLRVNLMNSRVSDEMN